MTHYSVSVLDAVFQDIDDLFLYIAELHKAPLTAQKYTQALWESILDLEKYAGAIPIYKNDLLEAKYGFGLRRINFKKTTILFTIEGTNVYILRVLPSSMMI